MYIHCIHINMHKLCTHQMNAFKGHDAVDFKEKWSGLWSGLPLLHSECDTGAQIPISPPNSSVSCG